VQQLPGRESALPRLSLIDRATRVHECGYQAQARKIPMKTCALMMIAALTAGTAAVAKDADTAKPVPVLVDIVACRSIADISARLACFDRTSAALESATNAGTVVVLDREAVRETRRGLFGFGSSIGAMFKPLLGSDDADQEEIKRIDTTVESVAGTSEGWRLRFAEGGTWEQNDIKNFVMSPKVGQKATITRSGFGTYFVSVNGQPGIKMRRTD
jgi:hypothetical protein